MNDNQKGKIESYVNGSMDEASKSAFEAELRENPVLATETAVFKTEWEIREMLIENQLRNDIDAIYAQYQPQSVAAEKPRKKNLWWLALFIALGLVGTIYTLTLKDKVEVQPENTNQQQGGYADGQIDETPTELPESTEKEGVTAEDEVPIEKTETSTPAQTPVQKVKLDLSALALAAYESPEGLLASRGTSSSENYDKAIDAFIARNYREAADLLKTLPEDEEQEALALRAHASFKSSDFTRAIQDFQALKDGGIYRRDAEWYGLLARMAVKQGSRDVWKTELEKMANNPSHPYNKKAGKLLSNF